MKGKPELGRERERERERRTGNGGGLVDRGITNYNNTGRGRLLGGEGSKSGGGATHAAAAAVAVADGGIWSSDAVIFSWSHTMMKPRWTLKSDPFHNFHHRP